MKHGANNRFQRLLCEKMALNDNIFGRVFQENSIVKPADPEEARKLLSKLAFSMVEPTNGKTDIGAGLTFFGQLIDHDITLDATSALGRATSVHTVRNLRTPALDLDCVFGNGPEASNFLYSGIKGKDGKPLHPGYLLYGTKDNSLDLARNHHGTALIGDHRNDENAILSQIQGLFIQFYNVVLHLLEKKNSSEYKAHAHLGDSPEKIALTLVRWHYQWLVKNEFLKAFVDADVLKRVLWLLEKGRFPQPFTAASPIIPIEFAVACYRFGHGTVQNTYKLNKDCDVFLFANTGDGKNGLPAFGPKPTDHNLDFTLFFDGPNGASAQSTRPLGTKIGDELFHLPPDITPESPIPGDNGLIIPPNEAISLAHRNIYRDRYSFGLASGQQTAAALGFTPIDRNKATVEAGIDKIPLWYYCLQEAEEKHAGKLGETGGTIVATVLLRLLIEDLTSIWYQPGWKPIFGAEGGNFSIGHMANFVKNHRSDINFWDDLACPG